MQKILSTLPKFIVMMLISSSLMMLLKDGDLVRQQLVDEGAGLTSDSVWSNLSSQFQLDHQANSARVQSEIHKLLADPDDLNRILRAAAPYIHFIYNQTRARGLPAEIALIPFVESEFNPNDHSKAGATGLWQLMPVTARELGVNVKSGYDGRRNIISSTNAALAYFKDLGNMFNGDWYLAIAAYNCGQGKVASVEKHAGSHDYWSLPLPTETKLYVPRLMAIAAIIQNPAKYGVQLPAISNQPYFTAVKVDKPVNLDKLASTTNVNIKTLNTLNPDYKLRNVPKESAKSVLVPVEKAEEVKTQLTNNPDTLAAAAPAPIPTKIKKTHKKVYTVHIASRRHHHRHNVS